MSIKKLNQLSIHELKIINSFIGFKLLINDGKIIGIEINKEKERHNEQN